jgi:hypothetical protein
MPGAGSLSDALYRESLPARSCSACRRNIGRREQRVIVRASWRKEDDNLCQTCWVGIVQAAHRYMLLQRHLPDFD